MGRRTITYALAVFALPMVGCTTKPVPVPNEYEVAIKSLDKAWLAECRGLGDRPDGQVGSLLQDFTDLSAVAAPCRADHNALVKYLAPLIEKAAAEDTADDLPD